MKKDAYLGLDLSGTGVKVGVVDRQGHLLAFGHQPVKPSVTPEGFVEFSFPEFYEAARVLAGKAIAESDAQILALSVSSQGQAFVSLDENDESLRPAMAWYDVRAAQANQLRETVEANLHGEAMPDLPPISSAPKIHWLREHFPEGMKRARRFLAARSRCPTRPRRSPVTSPTAPRSGAAQCGRRERKSTDPGGGCTG